MSVYYSYTGNMLASKESQTKQVEYLATDKIQVNYCL